MTEGNRAEVVQRYLDGLEWPASKDEVVRAAERSGASEEVLERLQKADAESFSGPGAVHDSLGTKA